MIFTIEPIKAFNDNYIWAIINPENKTVWAIDPGDANPVLEFCSQHQLQLSGILITHHHNDHCGGAKLLHEKFQVPVYGPKHENILATHIIQDNDTVFLPECNLYFKVIHIPGHTLEHIAFSCIEKNLLFCGDTLFSAGCGRVFEGTPEQMYASLMKLASLPDDTQIYCGHEYTLANLKFAKQVEPNNADINNSITRVTQLYSDGKPSLPSSIHLEKKINPFLRASTAHEFATIREWKNNA